MALRRARRITEVTAATGGDANAALSFESGEGGELGAEIDGWVAADRPLLGKVLVNEGVVDPDQLVEALREHQEAGERLGQILLRHERIDHQTLASALATQFSVPLADLRTEQPEQAALDAVGEELARKHRVVPLRVMNGRVYLATSDPLDTAAIEELTRHCRRIGLTIGAIDDIDRMLDTCYDALGSASTHIQAFELSRTIDDVGAVETSGADDNAPVVQVVNRLLTQGVRDGASDIHIEPQDGRVRVRFRIDGALTEAITLPAAMAAPIASRVKVLAQLNIVERRRPQDGQFSVEVDGRPIDVRTSVVATVHGEKVVLRLLDKTRSLIGLQQLGMSPELHERFVSIVKAPLGMMLCTGPTGSGKTTTLYASLTEVNDDRKNVVTVEDPVEYQFANINQMQISESAGIDFAEGLRGILRQDPDVILVGEIRDVETARMATQAALTGHFVLSSLHAVDSIAAVHRFIDMGVEPFLVASAINGVLGQRLVRQICNSCRGPVDLAPEFARVVERFGEAPDVWTAGAGCNLCNGTGYRGRVGVYELLEVTDAIRDLVVEKATHARMREVAIAEGMTTIQHEAFRLVREGVTTVEEVFRSVYAPGAEETTVQPLAVDAEQVDGAQVAHD